MYLSKTQELKQLSNKINLLAQKPLENEEKLIELKIRYNSISLKE